MESRESATSMDPNVWGPPLWDMLFSIAFNAKPSSFVDLQHLFVLLEKVMPCSHCRRSYSLYRKQLKPTTCIKNSDPTSASVWLWTIHDMVNQKLGKICISYDKLAKRHGSIAMITHDLIIVDIFSMIYRSSKPSGHETVVDFIMIIGRILRDTNHTYFKIPHFLESIPFQVHSLENDLFCLNNRVRQHYGLNTDTLESYKKRMDNAVAS